MSLHGGNHRSLKSVSMKRKQTRRKPPYRRNRNYRRRYIIVPTIEGKQFIRVKELLYVDSSEGYAVLHLRDHENHEIYSFVSSLSVGEFAKLCAHTFVARVHRSKMVNIMHIKRLLKGHFVELYHVEGREFHITDEYLSEFNEKL